MSFPGAKILLNKRLRSKVREKFNDEKSVTEDIKNRISMIDGIEDIFTVRI